MADLCPETQNLAKAIQDYVNAHSDEPRMVDVAVVLWEDVGYDPNGEPSRCVQYLVPTDNFSMAFAAGLCDLGKAYIMRDIVSVRVLDDEDE